MRKEFGCSYCRRFFSTSAGCEQHITRVHSVPVRSVVVPVYMPKKLLDDFECQAVVEGVSRNQIILERLRGKIPNLNRV